MLNETDIGEATEEIAVNCEMLTVKRRRHRSGMNPASLYTTSKILTGRTECSVDVLLNMLSNQASDVCLCVCVCACVRICMCV